MTLNTQLYPLQRTFIAKDGIAVTKITPTLNSAKARRRPKSSMRHVAVVNAIDVKQKSRRIQV